MKFELCSKVLVTLLTIFDEIIFLFFLKVGRLNFFGECRFSVFLVTKQFY
jgi:hypothetical protein